MSRGQGRRNWDVYDLRPACLPNCSSSEDRFFSWHTFRCYPSFREELLSPLVKPSDDPQKVLPQIMTNYVNTGKVRYFFKDTPVEAIHPHAFKAAEAALRAGEQARYREMHDRLFKNQQALAVG